jgi:methyl-accepting chemotaxis protein
MLNSSITAIANDTSQLLQTAQGADQATGQIANSITEIHATSSTLDTEADAIQGAVNQIHSSLKQVTANLIVLAQLTESAISSASNINKAIKDISVNTREQADIAREVQIAASTAGLGLVNSTRQGMEKIRHEVFTTSESIESLSAKSGDIGHIVGLIGDIAEETNLLALNAAILAAQAGPYGRAFAVVAEKVRALARRSTASTKDISDIINLVQQEIVMASKSVKQSLVEVDKGMITSKDAETALHQIVDKSANSLEMALQVEASIALQSKNIELNASAIGNFKKMTQDIKGSIDRQSKAAASILESVKELRAVSSQVRQSISEQAKESEQIASVIYMLFAHAKTTVTQTTSQKMLSSQMLDSFQALKTQTEQNIHLSAGLETTALSLQNQSELMEAKLSSFKIDQVTEDIPIDTPLSDEFVITNDSPPPA